MSWAVRDALPDDTAAIAAVHDGARRTAMPWLQVRHTDADTRRWIADTILPGFRVRVAEREGQVVGYAALTPGFLEALYIMPASQGHGIGSRLLDEAKAGSATQLRLYTFQRNTRARQFYEARGFRAVSFGDGTGNEEGEPDVLYEWRLMPSKTAI